MSYVLDAAIVGILLFCVFEGAYKGFIRAVLETGGGIIAGIGTYFLAKPLGKWLAENILNGFFEEIVSKKLLEAMGKASSDNSLEAIKNIDIAEVIKTPDILSEALSQFGADTNEVTGLIETLTGNNAQNAEKVVNAVAHPISITVATVFSAFIIFIVLMILIMFIAKAATGISYLAGLGKINRVFGFLFGFVKGAVMVLFISVMLHYITPYIAEPLKLDAENPYQNSYIYSFVDKNNPLIKILPERIE